MNADSGKIKKRSWIRRLAVGIGWTTAGLILLVVGVLATGTLMLTPERLTRLVNEEASKNLEADVQAYNVRFTLWSTFPHLCVELDSLHVRSRTLDSVPEPVRRILPDSASFLLSCGSVRGGVNLLKLLENRIWLRDVEADSISVNLLAVNDTLNNYDIIPSHGSSEVPYFHIDGMRVRGGGNIAYTSMLSDTKADVSIATASLIPAGQDNAYRLEIEGRVRAQSGGLTVLNGFPFGLDGDVKVRFRPFGVSTSDYHVSLGELDGRVSMDMDIGGNMKLNNFSYRMEDFSVSDLIKMLPPGDYPALERLDARLDLDATARLTSPYDFSSAYLPSAEVDLTVPDGYIGYTFNDGMRYAMDNVGLRGRFVFDGRDPGASYIDVDDLHAEGSGVDVGVSARITGLTTRPEVRAEVRGRFDLAELGRRIRELRPYSLSGDAELQADVRFSVVGDKVYGTLVNAELASERIKGRYGAYSADLRGVRVTTKESCSDALSRGDVLGEVPVDLLFTAENAALHDGRDSIDVRVGRLSVKGELGRSNDGPVLRRGDVYLSGDVVDASSGNSKIRIDGIQARLTALRMNAIQRSPDYVAPAEWSADSRSMSFVSHTPEFLKVDVPDALKEVMKRWRMRVDVRMAGAEMHNDGYPVANGVRNLDMTASFDSLLVRHVEFESGDTRGFASLHVGNLRQFLNSSTPAPLDVDMDLSLDTVQINQLARIYTLGHPNSAIARGDKADMAAGVDTVAIILPRNLNARIHATAMQTRYINLHLYDLDAGVRIADGRASVDTLHISSDFGEAVMRFVYDTSDLQRLGMNLDLRIFDVNVVSFFRNFPKLLEMMPSMKNLSGTLSADVKGRLLVFPDMYVNVPSVWADAHVGGKDLVLKQNRFIHHVARMLMIPGSEPLRIADIDVHAGIHSNLLEVFPFTFEVSKYKLRLSGLNNFDGDLYYHIGVEDWPLRLPFGVNVRGTYRKPELRFGGPGWKDRDGAGIAGGVQDYNVFNIVREMRRYMGEFVHTAAVYTGR